MEGLFVENPRECSLCLILSSFFLYKCSHCNLCCLQIVGSGINFPQSYPVGCLLGCVDVTDVLPQEEYREQVSIVLMV